MRSLIVLLGLFLILGTAHARLPVDYATVEIKGQEVEFPIGNKDREHDVYWLKKALNGDTEAREVFLGGLSERWFFIGEYEALWLRVTEDSEEIVKP